MNAGLVDGKWRQYLIAANALWGKVTGGRSGVDAASRIQAGISSYAACACQSSFVSRILVGLLIVMAILAVTYAAALALVSGAASHTHARTNHAMALQQAAAKYRLARGQCLQLQANGRDACIAEAHAEEDRARVAASKAPRGYLAAIRSQTDAAIDAGDRDSIVIEPACNVVSRGQASVCEIQVNSSSANALVEALSNRRLIQARVSGEAGEGRSFVQPRASTQKGSNRVLLHVRANSEARYGQTDRFNLAAASP